MEGWNAQTWSLLFTAITAIGSLAAAYVSWRAVSASRSAAVLQAKSFDADMSLRLAEIIQTYGDRLQNARDDKERYFSVNHDWINQLEVLCHLLNSNLILPATRTLIEPVVVEVLLDMNSDVDKREQLAAALSGPTALDQICRFAEKQGGDLKSLRDFLKE